MKMPFEKCPVCGYDLEHKKVEKLLKGGMDVAVLMVEADVCLHCGERLYSEQTIQLFEKIRAKLERHQTKEFHPLGQAFAV